MEYRSKIDDSAEESGGLMKRSFLIPRRSCIDESPNTVSNKRVLGWFQNIEYKEAAEVLPYHHQYETMHALHSSVCNIGHTTTEQSWQSVLPGMQISLAVLHRYYNFGSRLLCRDMKVH